MLKPNLMMSGEFSQYKELFLGRYNTIKAYQSGEIVIGLLDDRSQWCYYVLEGAVSFTFLHEDGGSRLSTLRGRDTIFPLYYTYSSTSMERSLEVRAIQKTKLLVIPKPDLRELMMEVPAIAIDMLDAYGKYCTYINYGVESQSFDTVQTKVCNFLYLHSDERGVVDMTHDQIGKAAGTTRENVTHLISSLRKEGVVTARKGSVVVLSKERLLPYCSYVVSSD